MSPPPVLSDDLWPDLKIGETLPSFTYELTQEMVDAYKRTVGNPTAAYPTVAGRHPARSFYIRYRDARGVRIPNTGQSSQYFNPPLPGSRIHVTASIIRKYQRPGKRYVVVEAISKDDAGRLIEISRLFGLLRNRNERALQNVADKWEP